MDHVQEHYICTDVPSSQAFRFYLQLLFHTFLMPIYIFGEVRTRNEQRNCAELHKMYLLLLSTSYENWNCPIPVSGFKKYPTVRDKHNFPRKLFLLPKLHLKVIFLEQCKRSTCNILARVYPSDSMR
jgi:hypothetical protein